MYQIALLELEWLVELHLVPDLAPGAVEERKDGESSLSL
jgi:hypothetical protein